jgi:hypothetical protein
VEEDDQGFGTAFDIPYGFVKTILYIIIDIFIKPPE